MFRQSWQLTVMAWQQMLPRRPDHSLVYTAMACFWYEVHRGFERIRTEGSPCPGVLGIAPITITVVTLGLKAYPAVPVALGVLSATFGGYLLSVMVGNAGRRSQVGMYERWGGRPSTQLLRTWNESSNPTQRDIWRQAIEDVADV
ncbi:hypothetical protein [Streptomyces sennicomposti]|uniref:hypothetical protein n=1 Tax=Streptomyces sennicomposti TaxID=2873384 RepID=UPI001CA66122|nr:hypothetical protein [Streptomyces sennicomposti]MBY8868409.1 hypothetical protein [Streptomyces sennicomposti]